MISACGSDNGASDSTGSSSTATGSTVPVTSVAGETVTVSGSGPVTLRVGQRLSVVLVGNITTGYDWTVTGPADPKVLEQNGEPVYTAVTTETLVVGSGGTSTTGFTAIAPGSTTVVLSYRRSFEPDQPDADTVTLIVTVTA